MARIALLLALALPASGCTAVAVGSVVAGGGALVATGTMYDDDCDTEGCAMSQAMALLLGVVGSAMLIGGGVYLAVDYQHE